MSVSLEEGGSGGANSPASQPLREGWGDLGEAWEGGFDKISNKASSEWQRGALS